MPHSTTAAHLSKNEVRFKRAAAEHKSAPDLDGHLLKLRATRGEKR